MRNLIIPCAGKSSRFTTKLPKWLLEHPSGNLMVFESIQGLPLSTFDRIIIVALKRHLTNELIELVNLQFKDVSNFELLLLENDTHSASDTVSQTIDKKNITGSIFIKDADDYFKIDTIEKNEVCTYSLNIFALKECTRF